MKSLIFTSHPLPLVRMNTVVSTYLDSTVFLCLEERLICFLSFEKISSIFQKQWIFFTFSGILKTVDYYVGGFYGRFYKNKF